MKTRIRFSEIILLVILIIILIIAGFKFQQGNMAYLGVEPNPYLLLVIFSSCFWGISTALYVSFFMTFLNIILLYYQVDFQAVETIFTFKYLAYPVTFMIVGPLLGELRERILKENEELKEEKKRQLNLLKSYKETIDYMEKVNTEIKGRLVGQLGTFKSLYESAKGFMSFDKDEIIDHLYQILEKHIEVQQMVLYFKNKKGIFYSYKMLNLDNKKEPLPLDDFLIHECLRQKKTVSLQEIKNRDDFNQYSKKALICGALLDHQGEVEALLVVYEMPFLKYTANNISFFSLAIDWASMSYRQLEHYDDLRRNVIYDNKMGLYYSSYFEARLKEEFTRAKTYMLPLTVMTFLIEGHEHWEEKKLHFILKTLSQIIGKRIRTIDCLSLMKSYQGLQVLLPIIPPEESQALKLGVEQDVKMFNDEYFVFTLKIMSTDFSPQMNDYNDLLARTF